MGDEEIRDSNGRYVGTVQDDGRVYDVIEQKCVGQVEGDSVTLGSGYSSETYHRDSEGNLYNEYGTRKGSWGPEGYDTGDSSCGSGNEYKYHAHGIWITKYLPTVLVIVSVIMAVILVSNAMGDSSLRKLGYPFDDVTMFLFAGCTIIGMIASICNIYGSENRLTAVIIPLSGIVGAFLFLYGSAEFTFAIATVCVLEVAAILAVLD